MEVILNPYLHRMGMTDFTHNCFFLQASRGEPSIPEYYCHCTNLSYPHRHKLIIVSIPNRSPHVFDECRCKPYNLTQDEWTLLLRERDERLQSMTLSLFIDEFKGTSSTIDGELLLNTNGVLVQRNRFTKSSLDGEDSHKCKMLNLWRPRCLTTANEVYLINNGRFLQTVATNSIINLSDWRLMDIIMKPCFNLRLHGNDFLQINSIIEPINKNRTIKLLEKTEFSGC